MVLLRHRTKVARSYCEGQPALTHQYYHGRLAAYCAHLDAVRFHNNIKVVNEKCLFEMLK